MREEGLLARTVYGDDAKHMEQPVHPQPLRGE